MKIISWNMGCGFDTGGYRKHHGEAITWLMAQAPDVALLQEIELPRVPGGSGLASVTIPTSPGQPKGNAVLVRAPRVTRLDVDVDGALVAAATAMIGGTDCTIVSGNPTPSACDCSPDTLALFSDPSEHWERRIGAGGTAMVKIRNGKHPKRQFILSDDLVSLARQSNDPFIRDVGKHLEEFSYSEVVPRKLVWKYLPDDVFAQQYAGPDLRGANLAQLSHLMRVVEAFEIVGTWRATELLAASVDSLNREHVVPAAVLSRSLLELTVRYGDAANRLHEYFAVFPWDKLGTALLVLDQEDPGTKKKVGLESFVERLMSGTKLKEALKMQPDMEVTNILSLLAKADKSLVQRQAGYELMPHYERLCEVAHPNAAGFQRYLVATGPAAGGWIARTMDERAKGEPSREIALECLWALSWCTVSFGVFFGLFQDTMRKAAGRLGRLMPA